MRLAIDRPKVPENGTAQARNCNTGRPSTGASGGTHDTFAAAIVTYRADPPGDVHGDRPDGSAQRLDRRRDCTRIDVPARPVVPLNDERIANRTILVLVAILLGAKALVVLLDPQPRLFMGDSGSYLHAASSGWVPPDRSYTYPLLIRLVAWQTQSLSALVLAQSFLGVLTALVLFRLLATSFGLPARIAAVFALGFALGPEQLFYERMVMAEACSLFALACMLGAGFAYLRDGRTGWLVALALAGLLAVSYRISLLPLVAGFTLLPVLIRGLLQRPFAWRASRRTAMHVLVVLAVTVAAHAGYKAWYDFEFDLKDEHEADYLATSGAFRLGLVLPLVTAREFEGLGIAESVTDGLPLDWNDRHKREALLWGEDTLLSRLREAHGERMADRIAGKIAMRAFRHDPLGLVHLAALNLGDYFNAEIARWRMLDDLGVRSPTEADIEHLEETFSFDARGISGRASPTREYLRVSAPWLTLCLFALVPLAVLALATGWRRRRDVSLLLALTSAGLFLGHALFSAIVSFRYLHAFPFFVLLNVGAITANLLAARSARLAAVDPQARRGEVDREAGD